MRIVIRRRTRRHFGIIKWIRPSGFSKSDYYPTIPSFIISPTVQLTVWDNCSLSACNILYPWLRAYNPRCSQLVCTTPNWNRIGKTGTRYQYNSELWQTVTVRCCLYQDSCYSMQCTEVLLDKNIRVWNDMFKFWSSEGLSWRYWWWS
jgi:hypothetical protein